MDDQNKNLILAMVLSFAVLMTWSIMFPPEELPLTPETEISQVTADPATPAGDDNTSNTATAPALTETPADAGTRIAIETDQLSGSLSTQGSRIDDLALTQYHETLDDNSDIVQLLRPVGEPGAYFATFGWAATDGLDNTAVPGPDTIWTVESGETLTPDTPITLIWDNGAGQIFRNTVSVDNEFMFTFAQSVENTDGTAVSARPYGLLRRHGEPADLKSFFILHEGLVRMSDGVLEEADYDSITDYEIDPNLQTQADRIDVAGSGWIGYTDHYWMAALIPDQTTPFRSISKYYDSRDLFQAEAVMPIETIDAGETSVVTTRFFAGAKEWETIRNYENHEGVDNFLNSIDWGWFFFLTKPIFWVLHHLHGLIGNMGWAIIALTFILKAAVFPLAYKSHVSMARMKELQPQIEELKEKTGDDKQAMQQGMMKLYKENKVNPAAGCLPVLLQIPIFFSLYKVIFVTIELRHEPWLAWITDLSAPDTSSIANLFGIFPWGVPEADTLFATIAIGILPIMLGISMWLQQRLNPAPADPTQQMIFAWMPWIFMFMLGSFASGLVLYWITNNLITFSQQYLIMRSHGAKPDVFGNIKSSLPFKKASKNVDLDKPKDK